MIRKELSDRTCEDCIHYDVCKALEDTVSMLKPTQCICYKEESRYIELPCEVGTYIYFITDVNGQYFTVRFGRVYEILITSNNSLFLSVVEYDESDNVVDQWNVPKCQWGKTVFLSREEAEDALRKEMN